MENASNQIEEKYDLFLSYSTDPDYELSRKIESFLESFHNLSVDSEYTLKTLQICRDGSDFDMHKILSERDYSNEDQEEIVQDVLSQYLNESSHLLVLCSEKSALSPYVNYEIKWFIKNKPDAKIYLAVTEGETLNDDLPVFAKAILDNNLPYKLSFDFRESKDQSSSWEKVKDFNDELTGLASVLNGYTSGELRPIWRRAEEDRLKNERKKLVRQRSVLAIIAAVTVVVAIYAFIMKGVADSATIEANISQKEAEDSRDEAKVSDSLAQISLADYKTEEFIRSLRNGEVYYKAEEYRLALSQFLTADSTARDQRYSEIEDIDRKKGELEEFIQLCNENI